MADVMNRGVIRALLVGGLLSVGLVAASVGAWWSKDEKHVSPGRSVWTHQLEPIGAHPHTPPEWLVTKVVRDLGGPRKSLQQHRWIRARTNEGVVWVFQRRGDTCLAEGAKGAVACDATRKVEQSGLVLGVFRPPDHSGSVPHDFRVFGVAPKGAKAARLRVGTKLRLVPVRESYFAAAAEQPIMLIRFTRQQAHSEG